MGWHGHVLPASTGAVKAADGGFGDFSSGGSEPAWEPVLAYLGGSRGWIKKQQGQQGGGNAFPQGGNAFPPSAM